MKRIFTFLLGLTVASSLLYAQGVDRSFVFIDENGSEVADGATIVRNQVEEYDASSEVINSGLSIKNNSASTSDYLRVSYTIEQIDNGSYQLCFPSTCNYREVAGTYVTEPGQLMDDVQDLLCVWLPSGDGECVVTLSIEILTKNSGFPVTYEHKGDGPSVTIRFIKSFGAPSEGGAYIQLADGVFLDGTTLYICSGVTSLGNLQVNPSEIYCYATIPPSCVSNTFTGYDATLHVPAAGMVSYFTTLYWYNFNNILSDAIEPLSVTMSTADAELEIGRQLSLSATVAPSDATPNTVYWSSSDASVATVRGDGTVNAITIGECDIVATCVDKVAICHVTVVNPRVTITLDKHEARLLPNHTMTLTATCSPIDVGLAVTSSNPAVAIPRLVNGTIMVVGVAEGTATITVNAADGWSNPDSCIVTVYTEPGDVNSDGYVNVTDVTKLISYVLSDFAEGINVENVDINNDGDVNITDVTTLISYVLNGIWPRQHGYVDLGLPSGTLWATCNVGASSPEEYGYYFAWGETKPKEYYDWSTYMWCNGSMYSLTKYCTNSSYGSVDNKTELDPEDDAAYVNWGPSWRMPSFEQLEELHTKCRWTRTTMNGVNGYLFTGPNGNSLFMPAAGRYEVCSLYETGSVGYYWYSSLYDNLPSHAGYMDIRVSSYQIGMGLYSRIAGFSVRAVLVSQN